MEIQNPLEFVIFSVKKLANCTPTVQVVVDPFGFSAGISICELLDPSSHRRQTNQVG